MGGVGTPVDQQFALRWNDFQTSILSSFRHLRDEEDFVDVTLACDGCSFTAHKVVLSACSPYFKTLLKANPCEHPIVILRDVKEHDMEALLSFMYNGEVRIGQDQLQEFLKTAQTLQVRGLTDVPPKDHYKFLNNSTYNVPWSTPSSSSESHTAFSHSRLNNDSPLSPPPHKRSRSTEPPQYPSSPHTPNHTDHAQPSRESLLSQALESTPHLHNSSNQKSGISDSSPNAHSTGEESNSSDTELSERGGGSMQHHHPGLSDLMSKSEQGDYAGSDHMGSMDGARANFSASLLGLQGLPAGLLPGPSGMHNSSDNNFVSRRGLDMMRVRATDPRPCPKCGKIYRSAHTLRTHLEDKHTVCPGYRCVLCGTVAKSRNSLHSHMSRQHRGISTKDLPVLPMPSPFDPELASKLLAKAGVKVSAAELRARSSPTGMLGTPQRSRLDLKSTGSSMCGGDDPEDLTVNNNHKDIGHRMYGSLDIRPLSPPPSHYGNSTAVITKLSPSGNHHSIPQSPKEGRGPPGPSTGSAILDTYLQMIAENSALHLSPEQAAAMAARVSDEQRRLLSNHHAALMNNEHEYSSAEENDDYSEEEGPQPIKAGD
ncbi:protein abrupt isoform X3 [Diaphorina citri]|uniref:Protein abrupt isoform X2 n=1 Tax=Diaphorina citri TaxID=121845 RepID=A0A1S3DCJ5_DIACI|nr:protein abrupt isoform X2 [Diaphorina citri]XP_026683600.1 protein abrupt isoform X3 [Diaphorina citri]KAI5743266.1 hypothetical protein M8J77_016261 [Diaphorina citri]